MMRCLLLSLLLGLGGYSAEARTLLLLPVQGELDKTSDLAAVNDLFREVVQNSFKGEVKSPPDSTPPCADKECALALAAAAKTDEVIFSGMRRLGSKWIFSATVVEVSSGSSFIQRGTAITLEDMEQVTRRVGEAVIARKNLEAVATIDNITQKEEEQEPTRRRSLYAGGLSLGYLYPVGNSYAYLKNNYSSSTSAYEEESYRQMVKVTWLNTWEFRQNMILGFDLVWAAPHVIGGDLNMQYLLSRSDFSPFLGGGVGLHYSAGDDVDGDDKRNSGPALNVQGGMILFRTYDIHVVARAQYHMVFNSDLDNGPSFDVGVVYQRREKEKESSGWGSFWKYYLVGALFVSLVTSLAGSD